MAEHLSAAIPQLNDIEDDVLRAELLGSTEANKVSDALVEEFGTERERLVRSAWQLRLETVRAILGGDPVDEEAASRRLGYDPRRHYVALPIAAAGSQVRGLERAVHQAAATLGDREPLVVRSGAARFDVWYGSFEPVASDAQERYEPPRGVVVAFGRSAERIAGRHARLGRVRGRRMSGVAVLGVRPAL